MASDTLFRGSLYFVFLCCGIASVTALSTTEAWVGDTDVSLVFDIPDTDEPAITIKLKLKPESEEEVAYIFTDDLSVTIRKKYQGRVRSVADNVNRQVTFTFSDITLDDAGLYQCFEGSNTKIEQCEVMLIIIRKPDPPIIEFADGRRKAVGENMNLHCQTTSSSLPPDHKLPTVVEWWIDPKLSQDRTTVNGDTLVFSSVQRDDEGVVFKCRSTDSPNDESKRIMSDYSPDHVVSPEFGPEEIKITPFIEYGRTHSINEAASLKYSCSVICEPACSVFWEFKKLSEESYSRVPSNYGSKETLEISTVRRQDHGEYRCNASNTHGSTDHSFYLNVNYMLTPIAYFNGQEKDKGSVFEDEGNVTLKCAFDSYPKPSISWYAPDHRPLLHGPLEGPKEVIGNDQLLTHRYTSHTVLHNPRCRDSGSYQCQSYTQEIGTMNKNITVDVYCKPSPVLEGDKRFQKDYTWELSYDLELEFLVEAWPRITQMLVESEKDGKRKRETSANYLLTPQYSYDRKQYLTLVKFRYKRNLTLEDNGLIFIIMLGNSQFEKIPFQFTIHTKGPPHPFSNVTVVEITATSIILSWTPGFDGGEAQTFSVFKHRHGSHADKWVQHGTDIPDSGDLIKEEVKGLVPGTKYTLQILAKNSLGNVSGQVDVTTRAAPASAMAAGAIVGIVFAIIIVLIILAVLFYVFVYRKKWGKGKPVVPSKVRAFYKRLKGHQNSSAERAKVAPNDRRPIFIGNNDQPNDIVIGSKESALEEDDYANANDIRKPMLEEPVYANNAENNGGDEDPSANEHSLHYATLDFSDDQAKKKGDKKGKKKKKAQTKEEPEEEPVTYSDISYVLTKAKEEEIKQEEEGEKRALEEEENPYQVVSAAPGTTV